MTKLGIRNSNKKPNTRLKKYKNYIMNILKILFI